MAVIINIDHETGDLSQYTSTTTDGGDLSVTEAAALASTGYGLSCLIDDTTAIYGQKNLSFPASGIFRFRFYLDPHGLTMADNDTACIYYLCQGSGSYLQIASVYLKYLSATGYQIICEYIDDNGSYGDYYYNITDAPHYIEFLLLKASAEDANDGICTAWVDGVQAGTSIEVDLYNRLTPTILTFLGYVFGAAGSGEYYLDQFIARDDNTEIGPHTFTQATRSMHQFRLRRAA